MIEDWSRSTGRLSEHIRRMKTHLYLLLLAVGISAATQMSSLAELLASLEQMLQAVAKNSGSLRIETPDNIDDVNCARAIFEGTEQLRTHPALKEFSAFFRNLETLRDSLTPHLTTEGECDTERRSATIFLAKLRAFIWKASRKTRRA